jgi:nucleoside-diphosphate-sugar epimerase
MHILILGGAGYIGSVATRRLANAGYDITVSDIFYFSEPDHLQKFATVKIKDTRDLTPTDFLNVDVVIDMAAISNDPAGEINPAMTETINTRARVRAAKLARDAGVARYLLLSSCSVYGSNNAVVDESSSLNPLTAYARSNVATERQVRALASARFCVVVSRLATVFGPSPSMRFDLVVNAMTLGAFERGRIAVTGGGMQYRPLVHVDDVVRAIELQLNAPAVTVNHQIFNIGAVNLRMHEVAQAIIEGLRQPIEVEVDSTSPDQRNYRITTDKAGEVLGFVPTRTIADGAAAIMTALDDDRLNRNELSIRLHGYRNLVNCVAS